MASNLWLSYAFLTASIAATLALLDKVVVSKQSAPPLVSSALKVIPMYLVFIVSAIILGDIGQKPLLPTGVILSVGLAFTVGLLYLTRVYLYYNGIEKTDVSRFIPFYNTDILIVLTLGALFLGESFALPVYGGVVLMFIGLLLISLEDITEDIQIASRQAIMFGVSAAGAVSAVQVLIKYLMAHLTRFQILFWFGVGGMLSVAVFLAWNRFRTDFSPSQDLTVRSAGNIMLMVNGVATALAYFTLTWALESGPVSLVTAIVNLEVLMVFFGVIILSNFTPEVLEEDMDRITLIQKFTATGLMLTGVIIIQLFN